MASNVASLYDNGGMIGATLDLGSTEQYIASPTSGTPSIVGTASANGASSVSLTGITGLAEGDLVLVFASEDNSTTSASITSSGWTSLVNGAFINNIEHSIAYKVMGATVDTSVSIASTIDAITVIALRDVEYTARSGFVSNGFTNSATIDPASITATDSDSVVLVLSAIDDDNSTISSPSTGYTTAVQDGRVGGSNAIMYKTGVSAGTEDPDTVTWSTSDAIIAYTLVLSPTSSVTYGNYKNSGIWSMDAVYELLRPVGISLFATATDNLSDGHGTNFASFTLTWPSSIESGMVAVILTSRDFTTGSTNTPTGFTLLSNDTTSGGSSAEGYIFYRECDGTESGDITLSGGSFYGPAAVMAVFDVGGNFSGMSETAVLLTTGDDPDPPSHTAASATQYISLAMAVYDDGPQYGITDVDVPTGYTKAVEYGTLGSNGTSSSWVVIAYKLNASQTENPSAFSQNGMTAIQDTIGYTAAIEIG